MSKVVESKEVPKTPQQRHVPQARRQREGAIGQRLIETPVDAEATEVLRNDHSPFIV